MKGKTKYLKDMFNHLNDSSILENILPKEIF